MIDWAYESGGYEDDMAGEPEWLADGGEQRERVRALLEVRREDGIVYCNEEGKRVIWEPRLDISPEEGG